VVGVSDDGRLRIWIAADRLEMQAVVSSPAGFCSLLEHGNR
jgi:hypothetical protein